MLFGIIYNVYIYIFMFEGGCLLQSEFISDGSLKSIAARGGVVR